MASDAGSRRDEARKKIAEANSNLANLQRQRFRTMIDGCLAVYPDLNNIPVKRGDSETVYRFELSASVIKVLASAANPDDFADSEAAHRLDRAAESFARQLRVYRKRVQRDYDVFLSYNAVDRAQVATIASYLEAEGLLPWFDQRDVGPGDPWLTRLQEDIESIKACAVIIGASGVGRWQNLEVQTALNLFVQRERHIIPVLVPTCGGVPQLPPFLSVFGQVDFRSLSPDPVGQLVKALSTDL